MVWVISFITLTGYNFFFWGTISFLRFLIEHTLFPEKETVIFHGKYRVSDVAAIIPAHNEEKAIRRTLSALFLVLPKKNMYVASDFSTDKTNEIVRSMRVKLFDIQPNKGKAKAIVATLKRYKLLQRYKLILINDADTEIDKDYLQLALPYFDDKEIAAVATHGIPRVQHYTFSQRYFITYRMRLWRIIQICMRFGQTWKYTNMSFIIPGSLSLYRSRVIKKLEIDAPNLVIEDFNMTFEVHKKRLGKIAYSPKIFGIHQDPYTLRDYIHQIERWNLGFFQTVKRHGIWPSFFWLATTAYYIELYVYALFFISIPILIVGLFFFHVLTFHFLFFTSRVTFFDMFVGVFLIDYFLTVITAFIENDPWMLLYGFGFIFLRIVDSVVYILSPFRALFLSSTGVWKSPKRL